MTNVLLQVVLWKMVKVFLVCWLVNLDVDCICRQHRLLDLVKQGRHLPFFLGFFRMTLLLFSVVWPNRSLRFRFLWYVRNGLVFWNVSSSSGLILRIFQCLLMADLIFGRFLWKVVIKGRLLVFVTGVLISNCWRVLLVALLNFMNFYKYVNK